MGAEPNFFASKSLAGVNSVGGNKNGAEVHFVRFVLDVNVVVS